MPRRNRGMLFRVAALVSAACLLLALAGPAASDGSPAPLGRAGLERRDGRAAVPSAGRAIDEDFVPAAAGADGPNGAALPLEPRQLKKTTTRRKTTSRKRTTTRRRSSSKRRTSTKRRTTTKRRATTKRPPSTTRSSGPAVPTVSIALLGYGSFIPKTLTVTAGATVAWEFPPGAYVQHNVVEMNPGFCNVSAAPRFRSVYHQPAAAPEYFRFTFGEEYKGATVLYGCDSDGLAHCYSGMSGAIVVT
ncbi:hypothetical protein DFJ74DRAFT_688229 [Hyaloraphidium curvatum]|nr:hypothetical protein DFJ74DRAFT_688229 [Hyaloraphidium curvatum]